MGNRFQAEGEIQFQYNSLKSTFQEFTPERSSSPDSVPPTTSSDDFDSDSALEHVPTVPEHIPAPPDSPARHPRQPRPPPPPRAPSSCAIKPTERGDAVIVSFAHFTPVTGVRGLVGFWSPFLWHSAICLDIESIPFFCLALCSPQSK
jgi:hypothetical protein